MRVPTRTLTDRRLESVTKTRSRRILFLDGIKTVKMFKTKLIKCEKGIYQNGKSNYHG